MNRDEEEEKDASEGKVYVCIMLYDITSKRRKGNIRKGLQTVPKKLSIVCRLVWSLKFSLVFKTKRRGQLRCLRTTLGKENGDSVRKILLSFFSSKAFPE